MMPRLNPSLAESDYGLFWITFYQTHDRCKAVLDTLADWVPAVKARGKKVVIFGVTAKYWLSHARVRQL